MKEYITIRCNNYITVHKRETIKKVEFDNQDHIQITWCTEGNGYRTEDYYPHSNAKQLFKRLISDLGADEETNKIKEI